MALEILLKFLTRFYGKILKYWQRIPGNPIMPQFIPENIIHIYYDKKEGFAFGTPYIVPVLDDIRSLRRMEENVEMLVTQHLFPLFHYMVGTETAPAEVYDDGSTEVDIIKEQIERMPTEGSIVTPERHTITNIGAQGKALDAQEYLRYFEKRVLAGLGISEIALGRGDTANRATASTIDKSMTDRCKDFQDVVENFVNEYMFKELLYEGGFVIDEKEDNFVKLKFREIDIDNMLKTQNHSVFKYEHHAITETEMREELSRDPVSDEQRKQLYFELVQKPITELEGDIQADAMLQKQKAATTNRNKPTNQHGTKPAKTRQKKDSEILAALMDHLWYMTKIEIVEILNDMENWRNVDSEKLQTPINLTYEQIIKQTSGMAIDHDAFIEGVNSIFRDLSKVICGKMKDTSVKGDVVFNVSGIFESMRFRINDLSEKVVIEQEEICQ